MKELDNDNQKMFNIKLNLYNEDIDIKINSDFNKLRKKICEIMKISSEQLDSLILSYIDEDGDNIRLSTEDDYEIFFKQVIEKTVEKIKIVFNNNSIMDENRCIKCLEDALNYQEEQSKVYVDDDDDDNKKDNNGIKDNKINENILLEKKIEDNVLNDIKIQDININEYQKNDNKKNNQKNENIKNSNNNIIINDINDNYFGNNNYRKYENFDNLINNIEEPINNNNNNKNNDNNDNNNNNNNEEIENSIYQYS